jgi:HEAT repeat protein
LRVFLALIVVAVAGHAADVSGQQSQATAPTGSEEAVLVSQGWKMLSGGDAGQAAAHASNILITYPRSVAALSLLVEAEIVRAGTLAGLDAYERWLGVRKIEDGYVIRLVALSSLRDAAGSSDAGVRLEALKALAADGDAWAMTQLSAPPNGGRPDVVTLASLGEERSVRALIAQINTGFLSTKMIDALGQSRSPLAIPPLTKLLSDESPDHRAAAASALGRLAAKEAVVSLVPLVAESQPFPVRFAAAGALHRLGNSEGTTFLRNNLGSQHETLRAQAAEELAAVPDDTSWVATVDALVVSRDPQVRVLAARLLARRDADRARSVLENLLSDQNPAIREAAGQALASEIPSDFALLRRSMRGGDARGRILAASRVLEMTR